MWGRDGTGSGPVQMLLLLLLLKNYCVHEFEKLLCAGSQNVHEFDKNTNVFMAHIRFYADLHLVGYSLHYHA